MNIALTRALAIEGRVLDPSDTPMADVTVMLMRTDGRPYPAFPVSSDDRGDYRLFGLSPGRYRVCAAPQRSSDGPAEAYRFVQTCHPAAVAPEDAADIVLTTSDASGMDIRVQRGGTFTVSGSVTDAAGAVVDSPHVSAFPIDRRAASGYAMGRAGRFVLRGLLPGRYVVQASVGGPDIRTTPVRRRASEKSDTRQSTSAPRRSSSVSSRCRRAAGRQRADGLRRWTSAAAEPTADGCAGGRDGAGLGNGDQERPPTAAVSDKLTFDSRACTGCH